MQCKNVKLRSPFFHISNPEQSAARCAPDEPSRAQTPQAGPVFPRCLSERSERVRGNAPPDNRGAAPEARAGEEAAHRKSRPRSKV